MTSKIFPRNLTARAAVEIAGNPVTSRLESSVGNCYPGLEFDHRNLDRRFFPGLVFEFVSIISAVADDVARGQGARLVEVDPADEALADLPQLAKRLAGNEGQLLREGSWFLEEISQGGRTIVLSQDGSPLDAMTTWRMVRSLEPAPITITLRRRPQKAGERVPNPQSIELKGRRRTYVDTTTGVISLAYSAGELSQSLCSPWMHDFRDCACFYWASNHPDIVLAADVPGEPILPNGAPEDPVRALTPIDWLRSDRRSAAPAQPTEDQNRPAQMDHYEINERWQDLAIVLRGRELEGAYQVGEAETANPFPSPDALGEKLLELATLEHAVALEYLYARYSLKSAAETSDKRLADDLVFVRHELLLIAVSEMRHLRWANQLLWSLEHDGMLTKKLGPSLGVATEIPGAAATSVPQLAASRVSSPVTRPRQLRALQPAVLADFVAVEQPSGFLDGQYSRVLATLRQKAYRPTLEQLAARIIGEGMEHFSRFREIQVALREHQPSDYLRPKYAPGQANDATVARALAMYRDILAELTAAYDRGDMEDAAHIARARALMFELDSLAEDLGRKGIGVPFFASPATTTKVSTVKRSRSRARRSKR
jgi:hypothetical protein